MSFETQTEPGFPGTRTDSAKVKRESGAHSLLSPFQVIWRYRRILLATTWVELRQMHAGSALGMAWAWIGPLLLLAIYAVVYAFIFRIHPSGMARFEYILYVFAGLGPFLAFSQALNVGAQALGKNKQLLLNNVFPAELLPVRTVLVTSTNLPVTIGVVGILAVLFAHPTMLTVLVLTVMVAQFMFSVGLAWILSLVTLLVRDTQQILQYITMVLMIATPIAYTPEMIPPSLKLLMWLNPLTYYVVAYQDLVVFGRSPSLSICAGILVITLATFWLGSWMFNQTKREILEYA